MFPQVHERVSTRRHEMEISEAESSQSHQPNGNNEAVPSPNLQQQESPGDQSEEPTKIVSLNDDCLMKVFSRLKLSDLCKVAIASEWLRPAAVDVYSRKFASKPVKINKCDDFQANARPYAAKKVGYFRSIAVQEYSDHVEISGLKTCLRYLRCFGVSISNLSIDYNASTSKRYQHVHDYISEYCAGGLTVVSFNELPRNTALHFKKPFDNVTTITIRDSELRQQLPSFSNWFPNVRQMNLCNVSSTDHFVAATFANLQCLSIDDRFSDGSSFLVENAHKLLHLNPQLTSIELIGKKNKAMTMDKLLQMIENNAAVRKLAVKIYSSNFPVKLSEVEQLANEHPALTELKLWHYHIPVENVNVLVRQLSDLKKVDLWIPNSAEYTELQTKLDSEWPMPGTTYEDGMQYIQINRKN